MIQLSSLVAALPHGPVRPGAPVSGSAGGFALPAAHAAAGEADDIAAPGRQILAAPGKTLPEGTPDTDAEDEGADVDGEDIAFAWFALPVAPQPAPTTPLAMAARPVAIGLDPDAEQAESLPMPPLPIAGDGTGAETVKAEPDAAAIELHPKPAAPDAAEQSAPIKLRVVAPAAQPAPAEAPSPAAAPQLAAALLAAAPAAATPTETRRTLVQDLLPAGGPTPFADIVRPHAIAAPTDIQQGVLDMRRQEWAGQMVDQLEAMRDASRGETRLSLSPEALGKVDVSIRQDGDRIHVHFATETQAARQLLTDAQPRLSELAEARGVKLGQTSVDTGGAGHGSPRERQPELSPQSSAPRGPEAADATTTATDDRIA
ncbi:flagellar hook-length control protein FliK [Sphingomonas naasensis]|uniref:Flagellar hook-length control protein FliK n=1 Tax=Sphingomonas naasensis TaxID=1344951 RepID=A0A4S1W5W4_9SPHN|nr:flagellar hook-length control protein FliK [Sphingomonas naasensis]NIJ21168.1 flagellar hook-length control protein FliK [Sphingomonas naasensis]TGX38251.1 flagellar hook-length control protein FliK [Sphingomonas naasensis]